MIASIDVLPAVLYDKQQRPFTVRRYEPRDRGVLEDMYASFEPKRAAQGLPPYTSAIARWLDNVLPKGEHLVVEIDGALLGHVMLIPVNDDKLELANFLHQSARNRGIGTAVNRLALNVARDAGAKTVWLSVEPSNRAAVRSYEKAGFRRTAGSLWAPEIDMEADLEALSPVQHAS